MNDTETLRRWLDLVASADDAELRVMRERMARAKDAGALVDEFEARRRAAQPAVSKAVETSADVSRALARLDDMQARLEAVEGNQPVKAGRVLSKANEEKIRAARDMGTALSVQLTDVLRTVETETDDPPPAADDGLETRDAEWVIELSEEGAEPTYEIDSELVAAAVRGALEDVVAREARAAVNAARGRID